MNILNVKKIVTSVLTQHEKPRDSDSRLVAVIWKHYLKADIEKMSALDLLQKLTDNELPNFESIRRVRQRLQEIYPHLRGANYGKRKEEETKVKKEIKQI
jgi:hypothetical protein